jgi:glutamate-1-semialdehyde aminotransferase
MAVFGKAMANGYPIGAVTGKKEIMDVLIDKAFLSSTFFPNSTEQIAALKTIEILEREKVIEKIKERGFQMGAQIEKLLVDSGIPAEYSGSPWMPFITFIPDEQKLYRKLRTEFYTQLIRRKVFLQPFHHGYIAHRHTDEDLKIVVDSIGEALDEIKKLI